MLAPVFQGVRTACPGPYFVFQRAMPVGIVGGPDLSAIPNPPVIRSIPPVLSPLVLPGQAAAPFWSAISVCRRLLNNSARGFCVNPTLFHMDETNSSSFEILGGRGGPCQPGQNELGNAALVRRCTMRRGLRVGIRARRRCEVLPRRVSAGASWPGRQKKSSSRNRGENRHPGWATPTTIESGGAFPPSPRSAFPVLRTDDSPFSARPGRWQERLRKRLGQSAQAHSRQDASEMPDWYATCA